MICFWSYSLNRAFFKAVKITQFFICLPQEILPGYMLKLIIQHFNKSKNHEKKPQIENLNHAIIEGIRDKKGKNIIQLDLSKLRDAPADYFIICEGDSSTHVKAISDSIYKKVKDELGTAPTHTEGSSSATWVLMDYFNIVVHVFHPETRQFYELENLWSDAEITEFGEI